MRLLVGTSFATQNPSPLQTVVDNILRYLFLQRCILPEEYPGCTNTRLPYQALGWLVGYEQSLNTKLLDQNVQQLQLQMKRFASQIKLRSIVLARQNQYIGISFELKPHLAVQLTSTLRVLQHVYSAIPNVDSFGSFLPWTMTSFDFVPFIRLFRFQTIEQAEAACCELTMRSDLVTQLQYCMASIVKKPSMSTEVWRFESHIEYHLHLRQQADVEDTDAPGMHYEGYLQ